MLVFAKYFWIDSIGNFSSQIGKNVYVLPLGTWPNIGYKIDRKQALDDLYHIQWSGGKFESGEND